MFAPLYEPPVLSCALSQTGHSHPSLQCSRGPFPSWTFRSCGRWTFTDLFGEFWGSDSAAAIPWCETKFVLRHLSPDAGKGYLITGISYCTRLIPQAHLDIVLTDINCLWTALTMSRITCNNQLILKQIYWAVSFLYKSWSDFIIELFNHCLTRIIWLYLKMFIYISHLCALFPSSLGTWPDHGRSPENVTRKTSPNLFGSTLWSRRLKSLARESHEFHTVFTVGQTDWLFIFFYRKLLSVFGNYRKVWDQSVSAWRFVYHR